MCSNKYLQWCLHIYLEIVALCKMLNVYMACAWILYMTLFDVAYDYIVVENTDIIHYLFCPYVL